MQIAKHSVVTIDYTLTDDAGSVIDSSHGGHPMTYLHGVGGLIPGMENALDGRGAGDNFKIIVSPEQGYGQRDPNMVQPVPRDRFAGVQQQIVPGMQFQAQTQHGPRLVTVVAVSDSEVTIDANHPLAGKSLHFDVDVREVRPATPEEISHGHVHGPGGHHH